MVTVKLQVNIEDNKDKHETAKEEHEMVCKQPFTSQAACGVPNTAQAPWTTGAGETSTKLDPFGETARLHGE